MEIKLFHGPTKQENNGQFCRRAEREREKIKDTVQQLYDVEKQSTVKIAKQFNVTPQTIHYWLRETNIPIRTLSESATLRVYKQLKKGFEELSPSKAYILGVLCGDGSVSSSQIELKACDKEFVEEFVRNVDTVYGYTPSMSVVPETTVFFPNTKRWHRTKQQYRARIRSREIARDLRSYNYSLGHQGRRHIWQIPSQMFEASLNVKGAFLRGLFDSEGCVATRARQIELVSTCKNGLKQTQELLSTMGIRCSCLIPRPATFDLMIHGTQNFRLFKDHVGFTINRKQDKLESISHNKFLKEID